MAVNLTAILDNRPSSSRVSTEYETILATFWRDGGSAALEQLTESIVEAPDNSDRFSLYRLWIEILAEEQERDGLVALADHLQARGASEEGESRWQALQGIARIEADQFQAAQLYADVLHDQEDAYACELRQLVAERTSELGAHPVHVAECNEPCNDYVVLKTLARVLFQANEMESLGRLLHHLKALYNGCPLPQLHEYHMCIQGSYFAAAAMVADRLREMYPDSLDYSYYYAFAMFEDGDYPTAKQTLLDAIAKHGAEDAEVCSLVGHCYAKLGHPEKSAEFLERSIGILKSEGLPSSHVRLELANVEEEMRGEQLDPAIEHGRETRTWFIPLSQRRYAELHTSSESTVDTLLRPMGAGPQPGDFCFFAAETPLSEGQDNAGQWKIAAIYAVDSEPMWHPTKGFHTALRLVSRLPEGIPVDIRDLDEGQDGGSVESHHPFNYGVYELEIGALDIITEAVRHRREDLYGSTDMPDITLRAVTRAG